MKGEIATITIHLFPNGMYVESEDTGDGKFIPEGDIQPLIDFINEVQDFTDPNTRFALTEKGKQIAKEL